MAQIKFKNLVDFNSNFSTPAVSSPLYSSTSVELLNTASSSAVTFESHNNENNSTTNLSETRNMATSPSGDRRSISFARSTPLLENLQNPFYQSQQEQQQTQINSLTSQQSPQQLNELSQSQQVSQLQSSFQKQQQTQQQQSLMNSQNALEMAANMQLPFGNSQQFLENAQKLFNRLPQQSPITTTTASKDSLNTNQQSRRTAQTPQQQQQMLRGAAEHPMGNSHVQQQQKAAIKARKEIYRFTNREPLFAANWSNKVDFRLIAGTILENDQIINNQVLF